MNLEKLKKSYSVIEKKYGLPSFTELNLHFEIEKIRRESEMLLRVVRKTMMDKIVNSLGFVEMFLNPANVPRMYMPFVKGMTGEDVARLEKIYSAFSDLIVASLELEVVYDEKKDAALIKKINSTWKEVQSDFAKIFVNIRTPRANSVKKERSYFG